MQCKRLHRAYQIISYAYEACQEEIFLVIKAREWYNKQNGIFSVIKEKSVI